MVEGTHGLAPAAARGEGLAARLALSLSLCLCLCTSTATPAATAFIYNSYTHTNTHTHAYIPSPPSSSPSPFSATIKQALAQPAVDGHVSLSHGPAPLRLTDEEIEQLRLLRGTPECVDYIQQIVRSHPGVEVQEELYQHLYPFQLDDFQKQGIGSLVAGRNVIVATPTGSGKTLVGELAIYFALAMGLRVFYTTPLKALSNQKLHDFRRLFGKDRVGLLTGDLQYNREAPITVLTTEVFRNMLYDTNQANEMISNLFAVIFDEFHYMNDPDRGTVWEESVVSCPKHVRIVALSATMGNVDDIKGWISAVHGPTDLVRSSFRPVPLRYYFATSHGVIPLFKDPDAGPGAPKGVGLGEKGFEDVSKKMKKWHSLNQDLADLEEIYASLRSGKRKRTNVRLTKGGRVQLRRGGPSIRVKTSLTAQSSMLVRLLHQENLLPAIFFIFSRQGCEDEANFIASMTDISLLNSNERERVSERLQEFLRTYPEIPITKTTAQVLLQGVGAHHAGLIPQFKVLVERLFADNLVKVLFATETLAAGINMPARTTVISSITKKFGSTVVRLKTSQLLQMCGRAGRRGKDESGTVVIMRSKHDDAFATHRVLVSEVDGIQSQFKISFGMAVSLLTTKPLSECRQIVERCFGTFLENKKLEQQQLHAPILLQPDRRNLKRILKEYGLEELKSIKRAKERIEKEARTEDYLWRIFREKSGADVAVSVFLEVDPLPVGISLRLINHQQGILLGSLTPVCEKVIQSTVLDQETAISVPRYMVALKSGEVVSVPQDGIFMMYDDLDCSADPLSGAFVTLLELLNNSDENQFVVREYSIAGVSAFAMDLLAPADLKRAVSKVMKPIMNLPPLPVPGEVLKQRRLLEHLKSELDTHSITESGDIEFLDAALDYNAALESVRKASGESLVEDLADASGMSDVMKDILREENDEAAQDEMDLSKRLKFTFPPQANGDSLGDGFFLPGIDDKRSPTGPWEQFQAVCRVLHRVQAVDSDGKPTLLGKQIGECSAENQLWFAQVASHPALAVFEPSELAAIVSAVVNDNLKASQNFIAFPASERVCNFYGILERMALEIEVLQRQEGVDFPILLAKEVGGLVESWATGSDWKSLCGSTSLDQGDLCRYLRRTIDALRQIPNMPGISRTVSANAWAAVDVMDRYPISDDLPFAPRQAPIQSELAAIDESSFPAEEGLQIIEEEDVDVQYTDDDVAEFGFSSSTSVVDEDDETTASANEEPTWEDALEMPLQFQPTEEFETAALEPEPEEYVEASRGVWANGKASEFVTLESFQKTADSVKILRTGASSRSNSGRADKRSRRWNGNTNKSSANKGARVSQPVPSSTRGAVDTDALAQLIESIFNESVDKKPEQS